MAVILLLSSLSTGLTRSLIHPKWLTESCSRRNKKNPTLIEKDVCNLLDTFRSPNQSCCISSLCQPFALPVTSNNPWTTLHGVLHILNVDHQTNTSTLGLVPMYYHKLAGLKQSSSVRRIWIMNQDRWKPTFKGRSSVSFVHRLRFDCYTIHL